MLLVGAQEIALLQLNCGPASASRSRILCVGDDAAAVGYINGGWAMQG